MYTDHIKVILISRKRRKSNLDVDEPGRRICKRKKRREGKEKMQVYALQWYMKTKLFLIGENRSEMW